MMIRLYSLENMQNSRYKQRMSPENEDRVQSNTWSDVYANESVFINYDRRRMFITLHTITRVTPTHQNPLSLLIIFIQHKHTLAHTHRWREQNVYI